MITNTILSALNALIVWLSQDYASHYQITYKQITLAISCWHEFLRSSRFSKRVHLRAIAQCSSSRTRVEFVFSQTCEI